MTTSTVNGTPSAVSVDFGKTDLVTTAGIYRTHKKLIDAASGYDSLDDAIASLQEAFGVLEDQADRGGGYTPDRELGFGSDNAEQIARSIMGQRPSVGSTRKAFNTLGK